MAINVTGFLHEMDKVDSAFLECVQTVRHNLVHTILAHLTSTISLPIYMLVSPITTALQLICTREAEKSFSHV